MKFMIALALLVAVATAAPPSGDADALIVNQQFDNIGIDNFKFSYDTSNGISQQEQGQLQNAGSESEAIAVRGSYSYIGPDGVTYKVEYVADENGFQPQGAHLPQA